MVRSEQASNVSRRRGRHARGALGVGAAILVAGLATGLTGTAASAGTPGAPRVQASLSDPVAGHGYRHGAVPFKAPVNPSGTRNASTTVPPRHHPVAGRASKLPLTFGGGSVVTGTPHVYLVFWGSQWGSQTTDGSGYDHYSGDPDGLAPNLQAFFRGLGTDNELWSSVLTQYCQGVAAGAKACPLTPASNAVTYPSGTVLAGVWEDTSSSSTAATATQIAQEAANAAVHFSGPPGAQYVIVSPTGTDPDGWLDPRTGYCAYHDNSGDPGVGPVVGPDVPYTNMPYVPDVGSSCSSFAAPAVNDGADETISHEYAETLTDPYPASGWTDRSGSEIGDKCENLVGGTPGGTTYITLATGTFAFQGIWANDLGKKGGCVTSHASILTVNPGKQKDVEGTPLSLPIGARDVIGQPLTFSASGLPAGLAINPSTGVISGTPTVRGRSTADVGVADGVSSTSVSFVWNIRR
jgi:serine protease